jgi:hypothetical protein
MKASSVPCASTPRGVDFTELTEDAKALGDGRYETGAGAVRSWADDMRVAATTCGNCPVLDVCRSMVLAGSGSVAGFAGGMTEQERTQARGQLGMPGDLLLHLIDEGSRVVIDLTTETYRGRVRSRTSVLAEEVVAVGRLSGAGWSTYRLNRLLVTRHPDGREFVWATSSGRALYALRLWRAAVAPC